MKYGVSFQEAAKKFEQALLSFDKLAAERIIDDAGKDNLILQVVEGIVIPSLDRIGTGWEAGDVSLAQVYMSGRICEDIIDMVLPPADPRRKDQPKMAIAVLDDHHILGKRIVYSCARASGFELLDYGHSDVDSIIRKIQTDHIEIMLISVLMLPSALKVKKLRDALAEKGVVPKIVVGGAPFRFDKQLSKEVGADEVGYTAADAIAILNKLAEENL